LLLKRSEQRYLALVDALAEGICVQDSAGRILQLNPAAEKILGVPAEQLIGKMSLDGDETWLRADGTSFPSSEHPAGVVLRSGQPVGGVIMGLPRADGLRWITVNSVPVILDGEASASVITSFLDVTDQIELQRRLASSEARFRDFAEGAGEWLWETDTEHRFTYISPNLVRQIFSGPPAVMGKRRDEIAERMPGDEENWRGFRADLAARRLIRDYIYQVRDTQGGLRWLSINGKAVYDEGGRFIGYRGVGNDVTALRQSELAARASEAKFRAIFEKTFQFIGLLSPEGLLLEANGTALRAIGMTLPELRGRPFWETPWWIHSSAERARLKAGMARAAQGEFVRFETSHPSADGLVWVDFSLSPVFDDDGRVIWIIPEGRDITERKAYELELVAAKAMAEASNQSKSQFLATMSHELRTPLNAILGYSEMVLAEAFGPIGNAAYAEYLGYIHESGERLLNVIQDILEIASIETGNVDLLPEPLQLEDIAAKVRELIAHYAGSKRLALEIDVAVQDGPFVADRKRIVQVLLNLLINAVKFTAPGGRIGLRAEQSREGTFFTVWDTGIGIAAEHLRKIWEPFGQVENPWVSTTGGVGLGLTLARHLVETQGGSIAVDSRPGEGTRFTLAFPLSAEAGR
jgi:PAS domain S-box-containing protein